MLGKGKFQDFDTTQLRNSPGFIEAYFRNKTSLLSKNKDVSYLLCISIKSLDFRDYEIFRSAFSKSFHVTRKKPEAVSKIAESCLGPCNLTPYLGT